MTTKKTPPSPADLLLKDIRGLLRRSNSWLTSNTGAFLDIFGGGTLSPEHVAIHPPFQDDSPSKTRERENPCPPKNEAEKRKLWRWERDKFSLQEFEPLEEDIPLLARKHNFFLQRESTTLYLVPPKQGKIKARRVNRRTTKLVKVSSQ